MNTIGCILLTAIGFLPGTRINAFEKISLPLAPDMTRADIYVQPCQDKARGTLVLCPGMNGDGEELIGNPAWINFARNESLNLVGISFASDDNPQDRGYFQVSRGSGQLLLNGLKQAFGSKQSPLFLYGFSRGAQFTYSFSNWRPDLVVAWCAYSATEWDTPASGPDDPKGIIACGEDDESNYSFSMLQFLKGRSMAKPWTWLSLAHQGHAWSSALDDFVRAYFTSILLNPQANGMWLDVDSKTSVDADDLRQHPTLAAWLPDANVAKAWRNLHQP